MKRWLCWRFRGRRRARCLHQQWVKEERKRLCLEIVKAPPEKAMEIYEKLLTLK